MKKMRSLLTFASEKVLYAGKESRTYWTMPGTAG